MCQYRLNKARHVYASITQTKSSHYQPNLKPPARVKV